MRSNRQLVLVAALLWFAGSATTAKEPRPPTHHAHGAGMQVVARLLHLAQRPAFLRKEAKVSPHRQSQGGMAKRSSICSQRRTQSIAPAFS
jgi:hypothetical protein